MNQHAFWHTDIDSRNLKDGLWMFSFALVKMLSANHKSATTQEQLRQSVWCFACWYRFKSGIERFENL